MNNMQSNQFVPKFEKQPWFPRISEGSKLFTLLDMMPRPEYKYYISRDIADNNRQYTGFRTSDELQKYVKSVKPHQRVFNEVKIDDVNNNIYQRLHIDVDLEIKEEMPYVDWQDELDFIQMACRATLVEIFPVMFFIQDGNDIIDEYEKCIPADIFTIADSSGEVQKDVKDDEGNKTGETYMMYKHSAHIILKYYGTWETAKYFNESVCKFMQDCEYDYAHTIDDQITKGKNQSLRLTGCLKRQNYLDGYPRVKKSTASFENTLLTVTGEFADKYNLMWCNHMIPNIEKKVYAASDIPENDINKILQEVQAEGKWIGLCHTGNEPKSNYVSRIAPGYCEICQREHESMGGIISHTTYKGIEKYSFWCMRSPTYCADKSKQERWATLKEIQPKREILDAIDAVELYKNFEARPEDFINPNIRISYQNYYELFDPKSFYTEYEVKSYLRQTVAWIQSGVKRLFIVKQVVYDDDMINSHLEYCKSSSIDFNSEFRRYYAFKDLVQGENEKKSDYDTRRTMIFSHIFEDIERELSYCSYVNSPVSPLKMTELKSRRVLNLYMGPSAYAKLRTIEHMSNEEIEKFVQPVLDHIFEVFCDENESYFEWFMAWIYHHIMHPETKTKKMIILQGVNGCGKSCFWKWFGRYILGDNLFLSTTIDKACRNFNALNDGRKLLFFEEVGIHEGTTNIETLKELITEREAQLELKGVDSKKVRNIADMAGATNNENFMKLVSGQRRVVAFHCRDTYAKSVIGDMESEEYFKMFYEDGCGEKMGLCFFKYIMTHKQKTLAHIPIPVTPLMLRMMENSLPEVADYIIYEHERCLMAGTFGAHGSSNMFAKYKLWAVETGVQAKYTKKMKTFKSAIAPYLGKETRKVSVAGSRVMTYAFTEENINKLIVKWKGQTYLDELIEARDIDRIEQTL